MARRIYEGSPEDVAEDAASGAPEGSAQDRAEDAAGQARMNKAAKSGKGTHMAKRHPELNGDDTFNIGSHHAINPMHRPGPHHKFGGHNGQTRGPATDGYPHGLSTDGGMGGGETAPPNTPGGGGNMGGY
jgi:hypothetical protein